MDDCGGMGSSSHHGGMSSHHGGMSSHSGMSSHMEMSHGSGIGGIHHSTSGATPHYHGSGMQLMGNSGSSGSKIFKRGFLFCCGVYSVVFGIFLCFPGVVLLATSNSLDSAFDDPFFDSHRNDNSTMIAGAVLLTLGLLSLGAGIAMIVVNARAINRQIKNDQQNRTATGTTNQPIVTGVSPTNYNTNQQQLGYPTQQPYPGQVQPGPQPGYPPAGYSPPQAAGYPPPQAAGYPPQGSYPPPPGPQPAYPLQPYPSDQGMDRPPPEAPSSDGQPTSYEKDAPPPSYDEFAKR